MNEHVLKALKGMRYVDGPPRRWLDDEGRIPYVTLCVGGVKPEGGSVPILCATEEMAWVGFAETLERYIARHAKPGDILHWRMKPELWADRYAPEHHSMSRGPFFAVEEAITLYTVGARLALAPEMVPA